MIISIDDNGDWIWKCIDDIFKDDSNKEDYEEKPDDNVSLGWHCHILDDLEDDYCECESQLEDICEDLYEAMGEIETSIEKVLYSTDGTPKTLTAECKRDLEYKYGMLAGLFKALIFVRKYQNEEE